MSHSLDKAEIIFAPKAERMSKIADWIRSGDGYESYPYKTVYHWCQQCEHYGVDYIISKDLLFCRNCGWSNVT